MRNRPFSKFVALVTGLAALAAAPAWAQDPCLGKNLCIPDLTAPNIIGDSNLNGQPDDGPRVFTIGARAGASAPTSATSLRGR